MGYPTPDQWRAYADTAQTLADAYRAVGNESSALRKEDDSAFYEAAAWREEWRLNHKPEHKEAA